MIVPFADMAYITPGAMPDVWAELSEDQRTRAWNLALQVVTQMQGIRLSPAWFTAMPKEDRPARAELFVAGKLRIPDTRVWRNWYKSTHVARALLTQRTLALMFQEIIGPIIRENCRKPAITVKSDGGRSAV